MRIRGRNAGAEKEARPEAQLRQVENVVVVEIGGVNLTGAFLCAKHAIPHMIEAGGGHHEPKNEPRRTSSFVRPKI